MGQPARVGLNVAFSPGSSTARAEGRSAESIRELSNRMFNFQPRDSPAGLLARDKWRSWRFDRFAGVATSQCPQNPRCVSGAEIGVDREPGPAFAAVEFQIGDTFYQLACRPPRGVSVWERIRFTSGWSTVRGEVRDPPNEPAISSHQLPPDGEPPV